jgi:hypothetical protein
MGVLCAEPARSGPARADPPKNAECTGGCRKKFTNRVFQGIPKNWERTLLVTFLLRRLLLLQASKCGACVTYV